MSGTDSIVVGDRGRLVVPAGIRERRGLAPGTPLIIFDTDDGLVLMTRAQLRARVRAELDGLNLVTELLAERRQVARHEDVA